MKKSELFPQKLALGKNFCNRVKEQKFLKDQITAIRPSLIVSPRRYGKTSLGIYVLENLNIPYVHLDLFPLANTQDVENVILSGIGDILGHIESTPKKAFKTITEFFGELSVSFNIVHTKIQVSIVKGKSSAKTLLSALTTLDKILQKKKKKAVLFLDEFQRLGQMPFSEQVEGSIRHIAQKSKNLIFIFSGSNRHLLGKMFDERHRPLYKLCDRLTLDRIAINDYIPFIQKQAKQVWNKTLELDAIEAIFECTKRHPYYINALCYRLWREENIFNSKFVFEAWKNYALGEKSTIFRELEGLSGNQLKLLISLARFGATESVLGDEFLIFSSMALSSAKQSLKVLQEKDYVYYNGNFYQILDPLIEYILAERP